VSFDEVGQVLRKTQATGREAAPACTRIPAASMPAAASHSRRVMMLASLAACP
jgi:hypothetical protein